MVSNVCKAMVICKHRQLRWPCNLSASSPGGFFSLPLDWEVEHLALSHSSAAYYHVISFLKAPISFLSNGHEELRASLDS